MEPAARGDARLGTSERWAGWILAAALVCGCARFVRLGRWSLWFDEAATWTDVYIGLDGGEIHNPLGYHAIAWVVRAFGGVPDEVSLRLLPAVCGVLSIALTWWAFRPFAGSLRAAAAALLVAVSSWHLYWSQTARFYTMAQAVSLLGAGILLRGLWSGRIVVVIVGFAVAACGGLFHPSAALVLPALVAAPWIARLVAKLPQSVWKPAIVLLSVCVVALLWKHDWAFKAWEGYRRQKGQGDPFHLIRTAGFYITPLYGIAALMGGALALVRRDGFHVLALTVAVLVFASALCMSLVARVSAQYVFVLLPWIALLACVPLVSGSGANVHGESFPARRDDEATRAAATMRIAWVALLSLPSMVNMGLYLTVREGERPQWREAYQFVWNRREPDDLILGMEATVGEFYLAPLRNDLRQPLHVAWLDRWRARVPEHWSRHARRVWFILNPEQLLDWKPEDAAAMRTMLREECRLVKCFPLYVESRDLSVWVYLRD